MTKSLVNITAMFYLTFVFWLAIVPLDLSHAAEGTGGTKAASDRSELAGVFLEGVRAYDSDDYDKSLQLFSQIASSGLENGLLYYNLGNAYLKTGDLGRAILWYERARSLIPGNADLEFNLAYARGLTTDSMESADAGVSKILFFWKFMLERRTILILALCMNGLFWALLTIGLFVRRPALKKLAAAAGLLAAVFVLTTVYNNWEDAHRRGAVVLPSEVIVRSGLDGDSTELFRLHAGALVYVDRVQDDYARITFSRDHVGWLPLESIGEIHGAATGKNPG